MDQISLEMQQGVEFAIDLALANTNRLFNEFRHFMEKEFKNSVYQNRIRANIDGWTLSVSANSLDYLIGLTGEFLETRTFEKELALTQEVFEYLSDWDLYPHFGWRDA